MADPSPIRSARVSLGAPSTSAGRGPGGRMFRAVWVGDLRGDGGGSDGGPWPVDRNLLRDRLREWRPRLALDVPNRLDGEARTLEVSLAFEDFRDFRPEAVVEHIAPLRSLLAVRRTVESLANEPLELESLAGRLVEAGADPDWARRFQQALLRTRAEPERGAPAAAAPPPTSADDPLAGLLAQVDLPGVSPRPGPVPGAALGSEDAFAHLLRTLAGTTGRQRRAEKAIAADVVGQIDEALGLQLEAVMHHPRFLALEGAWRALRFVVERSDFRRGIVLEVLPAPKPELVEILRERLHRPEYETPRSPGLGAVWLDHEFDATVRDVEALGRIGEMADSLQAPFVAAAAPAMLGVARASEVARLSPLRDHFQRPEFIPLRALRGAEASRSLALAFPRVLARMPYGPEGDPVRGFDWREPRDGPLPWISGVAAVAARVHASHATLGWPNAFVGRAGGGEVEDLPLADVELPNGRRAHAPLDVVLGDELCEELEESGFVVLTAAPNRDAAVIAAAPTLHRVEPQGSPETDEEARREASLAFRLVVAQVSAALQEAVRSAPGSSGEDAVREHVEQALASALGIPPASDRLAVEVEPSAEHPGRLGLGIYARLPVMVRGAEVALDLGVEIDR